MSSTENTSRLVQHPLVASIDLCELALAELPPLYPQDTIGYTALSSALDLSEMLLPPSCDHTFSFLLSFAHSDFSLSDLYPSIRRTLAALPPSSKPSSPETYQPIIDNILTSLQKPLSNIFFSQPLLLLLEAQEILPESELALGYALLKTLERVAVANQRNNILLSQMSFVSIIVPRVFGKSSDDATVGVKDIFGGGKQVEHQKGVLFKLVRRVIEAGTTHAEARALFHLAVKEDDVLDDEVLDLVRHGMKSRWPGTINCLGKSWIECRSLGARGFTKDSKGFTSMVGPSLLLFDASFRADSRFSRPPSSRPGSTSRVSTLAPLSPSSTSSTLTAAQSSPSPSSPTDRSLSFPREYPRPSSMGRRSLSTAGSSSQSSGRDPRRVEVMLVSHLCPISPQTRRLKAHAASRRSASSPS